MALQADKKKGFSLATVRREPVREPRTAIITNTHASIQQGGMWYLLDARYAMNHSLVDATTFTGKSFDPTRYDAIIFSGDQSPEAAGNEAAYQRLKEWVENGGTLILMGAGNHVSEKMGGPKLKIEIGNGVSGVVMNVQMVADSPLFWGYEKGDLDLLKLRATVWGAPEGTEVLMRWSDQPYRSGCISGKNLSRIAGSPTVVTARMGKGIIVFIQEDVTFRSYWFGANHLLTNAIYFGNLL